MTAGRWHPNDDGHKGSKRLPLQSLPVSISVKRTVTKLSVIPHQGHQPQVLAPSLTPEQPSMDGLETPGSQESCLNPG